MRIKITTTTAQGQTEQIDIDKRGTGTVKTKALAQGLVSVSIDGVKQTGNEKINGKAASVKKKGNNLVIEVEGEELAEVTDFFTTEGATLDGAGWIFAEAAMPPSPLDVASASQDVSPLVAAAPNFFTIPAIGAVALSIAQRGSGDGPNVIQPSSTINGTFVGGPALTGNGLTVTLYDMAGNALGTSKLKEDGSFSVNIGTYTGAIVAKISDKDGGFDFWDEATGVGKDINAIYMSVDVVTTAGETLVLHINAATTIAAVKAGFNPADGSGSVDGSEAEIIATINAANAAVAKIFGQSGSITQAGVSATINQDGTANTSANAMGKILAALSGVDETNGGDMAKTINAIATAINGTGTAATLSAAAQATVLAGAINADVKTAEMADLLDPTAALTASALVIADTNIEALSATVMAKLSSEQLQSLSSSQVAQLSGGQLSAIQDLDSLGNNLQNLSTATVSAISSSQMSSLSDLKSLGTKLESLSSAAASAISSTQLNTITDLDSLGSNLQNLSTATVVAISSSQLGTVTDLDSLGNNLQNLSTATVVAISSSQLSTVTDLDSLGSNLQSLSTATVATISSSQLGTVTDLDSLGSNLQNLSTATVNAISSSQISTVTDLDSLGSNLQSLSTAAVSSISAGQVSNMDNLSSLGSNLNALSTTAIAAIAPSQVTSLLSAPLSANTVAALSTGAKAAASTAIAAASTTTISSITPALFGTLSTTDAAALAPTQMASISGAQISAITNAALSSIAPTTLAVTQDDTLAALSPTQQSVLTTPQLTALPQAKVDVFVKSAPMAQIEITTNGVINATANESLSGMLKLPDGGFLVSSSVGYTGSTTVDVIVQRFDAAGKATGSQIVLTTPTDVINLSSPTMALVGNDGSFVVAVRGTEVVNAVNLDNSIYLQRYNAQGQAMKMDGTAGTDWYKIEAQALTVSANSSTVATGTNAVETGRNETGASLVTLADGSILLTFQTEKTGSGNLPSNGNNIFQAKLSLDLNGVLTNSNANFGTLVNAELLTQQSNANRDTMAQPDGGWVTVFSSSTRWLVSGGVPAEIWVAKFNADGTRFGVQLLRDFPSDTLDDSNPRITLVGTGGEFVLTWQGRDAASNDWSIYIQRFLNTGVATGSMTVLEAPGVASGADVSPRITALGTLGAYAVAWQGAKADGSTSVFVQRFTANGIADGASIEIEGVPNFNDNPPQIVQVGSNGDFVVMFQGTDTKGDGSVFYRKFSAAGAALTAVTRLQANDNLNSNDTSPSITEVGSDGSFAIAFNATDLSGDSTVYVQRVGADGILTRNVPAVAVQAVAGDWQVNASEAAQGVTLTGTGPINGKVKLQGYEVNVDGSGNWTLDFGATFWAAMTDGTYRWLMVATTQVGEVSSEAVEFTLDRTLDGKFWLTQGQKAEPVVNAEGNDTASSMAHLGSGRYVVAWTGADENGDTSVFLQLMGADGKAELDSAGAPKQIKLEGIHRLDVNEAEVQVKAAADGSFTVIFRSQAPNSSNDQAISLQRFDAQGNMLTPQIHLDAIGRVDTEAMVSVVSGTGDFVVAWRSMNIAASNETIAVQRFTAAGVPIGGRTVLEGTLVTTALAGPTDRHPLIEALRDTNGDLTGAHVVAWTGVDALSSGDKSIFVQYFDAQGKAGARTLLEGGNTTGNDTFQNEASNDIPTALVALKDGGFVIGWTGVYTANTANSSVYLQRFDANGLTVGSVYEQPHLVSSVPDRAPTLVALGNGGFAMAFEQGYEGSSYWSGQAVVQVFNANGEPISLTTLGNPGVVAPYSARFIRLAALGTDGSFVSVYRTTDIEGDISVMVQRYNGTGAVWGEAIALQAPGYQLGSDDLPQLVALAGGAFAVSWSGAEGINGESSIYTQRFGSDGLPVLQNNSYVFGLSAGGQANSFYAVKSDLTVASLTDIKALGDTQAVEFAFDGTDSFVNRLQTGSYKVYAVDTAGNIKLFENTFVKGTTTTVGSVNPVGNTATALSAIAGGTGGFVINGQASDGAGWSVSNAGDVNGDGLMDLIVGAPNGSPATGSNAGRTYVVFGRTDTTAIDLLDVAGGVGGFVINGQGASDQSGYSVSAAGDVNGDGLADLIVGAPWSDPAGGTDGGRSYVVFGRSGVTATNPINLSAVAGTTGGFVINGMTGFGAENSGWTVSGAGDTNGDGFADLIIGAPNSDPTTGTDAGRAYVVYGRTATTAVALSTIATGSTGWVMNGQTTGDLAGWSVSGAGDVNGDGLSDLIVSAKSSDPTSGTDAGRTYVVFGKNNQNAVNLSAVVAGTGGFAINGAASGDASGYAVSGLGDVNGDGLADLLLSSKDTATQTGRSYVVFGKTTGTAVDLSAVTAGTGGFAINGATTGDQSGFSVSGAGDVNGDGLADFILSAPGANGGAGRSYVVFGKTTTSAVNLTAIAGGTGGFAIDGVATEGSGMTVSAAGDINGDGLADLVVGTPTAGSGAGKAYVILGSTSGSFANSQVTQLGTAGDNTLTATGADVMLAGAGNDTLVVGTAMATALMQGYTQGGNTQRLARVDGGTGVDTLRLTGGASLDLTITANVGLSSSDSLARVAGIERVDMATDATANTFKLAPRDLLDMASLNQFNLGNGWTNTMGTPLAAAVNRQQLVVNGGSNDLLWVMDNNWTLAGTATSSITGSTETYNVWNNNASNQQLLVQSGVQTQFTQAAFNNTRGSELLRGNWGTDLSAVAAGTGGFVVSGQSASEESGTSVSSLGDVNGDGLADFIIGAPKNATAGANAGRSYVVFGQAGNTNVELNALGTGGFAINAEAAGDLVGSSVSAAGDLNGDGLADFIVGAPGANGGAGRSYVVFGKVGSGVVNLADIAAGTGGFVVRGEAALDASGTRVAAAGDINGDGYADLVIGAPNNDVSGTDAGRAYVVLGSSAMSGIDLSAVAGGMGGFVLNGQASGDNAGWSVSGAGDVNGDGLADFIVGAPNSDPSSRANAGRSYVVFGRTETTNIDLSAIANGTGGFAINGQLANSTSGVSVSYAGDTNGDGLADLIVGAPSYNGSTTAQGRAYVIFGKTTGTAVDLNAVGASGFVISAQGASDAAGYSVTTAGDINGDGLADLLVGVRLGDPTGATNAGRTYVVFGKENATAINLSDIQSGIGGFLVNGQGASDESGFSVSAGGDINGDGLADLIIGAPLNDGAGANAGRTYVLFGGTSGSYASTYVDQMGTNGDNEMFSKGSQTLAAGAGNDKLWGNGADVLLGAAGNDTMVIDQTTVNGLYSNLGAGPNDFVQYTRIDGGTGIDTISLRAGANLDLTQIANQAGSNLQGGSRISSVERIDLGSDTAANALKLNLADVLDMAGMNLFTTANGWTNASDTPLSATVQRHQLVVDGTSADTVQQVGGINWTQAGTVTSSISGNSQTYNVWNHNTAAAQMLIDADINRVVL